MAKAHAIKDLALHYRLATGMHPSINNNQTIGALLTPCWLKSGHGESSAVQSWLKRWQIVACIVIHWLNTLLWAVKNMQSCFLFWWRNLRIGFKIPKKKKKNQQFMFSVHVNTWTGNFQMECRELQSDIQLKNLIMSLCQTFIILILTEINILRFTITLYSCHRVLAAHTFVSSCFQGWSTGREKFHQKSLMNTLRA